MHDGSFLPSFVHFISHIGVFIVLFIGILFSFFFGKIFVPFPVFLCVLLV